MGGKGREGGGVIIATISPAAALHLEQQGPLTRPSADLSPKGEVVWWRVHAASTTLPRDVWTLAPVEIGAVSVHGWRDFFPRDEALP